MTEQQYWIRMAVLTLLIFITLLMAAGVWVAFAGYFGSSMVVMGVYYIVDAIQQSHGRHTP